MTVYLAPEQPRWQPSTESEIASVIEQGLLRETHYFNGKRQLDSTSADRKELARDLASFAMDGGALLIGVEELKQDRTWRLAPQPLDGLAERVEQVATQLIDPPLYVRSYEIGATDTTGGYLFVEVPSARAPHMVGGIYYGRGDVTRTHLSDAEVLRLHARRESLEGRAEHLLDLEVRRDPAGAYAAYSGKYQCGRLYGVAQPLTAQRGAGRALLSKGQHAVRDLILSVDARLPQSLVAVSPGLCDLTSFSRRAQGAA